MLSAPRVFGTVVALALVAILAAGCGVLPPSIKGLLPSSSEPPPRLEKRQLKVGVIPIVDVAPFFLALRNGYFAEEGLRVRPVMIQGGEVAVPQLASGRLDVSFANYVSLFQAQARGTRLHILAEGYQAAEGVLPVMAAPGSGVDGPGDLAGKRIAVNTLHNIGTMTVESVLETYGVDASSVQFVEVPFPDMDQALKSRSVDAAWMVEPFVSEAETTLGAYPVVDSASGATQDLPIAGYASTQEFFEQNPRTSAAFRRALVKGQRLAAERSNVEAILPDYAKIDRDLTPLIAIGTYPTSINNTRLQRVASLMRTKGIIDSRLNVSTLTQ